MTRGIEWDSDYCSWIPLRSIYYSRDNFTNYANQLVRSRILSLTVSTDKCITSGHVGAICCSTLDKNEKRFLLSGGIDSIVCLYDLNNFQRADSDVCTLTCKSKSIRDGSLGHSYSVSSIQWYPIDNGAFLTSSFDGSIKIWNTNTFSVAGNFKLQEKILCARIRNIGGDLIGVGTEGNKLRLCDAVAGGFVNEFIGHRDAITSVDWCPNNMNLIASASKDGTVRIWDTRKSGSGAILMSLDFHQDHTFIATSKTIKHNIAKAHDGEVMCVKYSPSGFHLITSGNDKRVLLWDTYSGKLLPFNFGVGVRSHLPYGIEIESFTGKGDDLLLCPSAIRGEVTAHPMLSSTGEPLFRLTGAHMDTVNSISLDIHKQIVITSGRDGMIFLWEPPEASDSDVDQPSEALEDPASHVNSTPIGSLWSGQSSVSERMSGAYHHNVDIHHNSSLAPVPPAGRSTGAFVPPILRQYYLNSNPRSSSMNIESLSNYNINAINREDSMPSAASSNNNNRRQQDDNIENVSHQAPKKCKTTSIREKYHRKMNRR